MPTRECDSRARKTGSCGTCDARFTVVHAQTTADLRRSRRLKSTEPAIPHRLTCPECPPEPRIFPRNHGLNRSKSVAEGVVLQGLHAPRRLSGPVDWMAFWRFASSCLSLTICYSSEIEGPRCDRDDPRAGGWASNQRTIFRFGSARRRSFTPASVTLVPVRPRPRRFVSALICASPASET
jgi:hypothetical protein